MIWILIAAFFIGLWFYPVCFVIEYEQRKIGVYWQPHLLNRLRITSFKLSFAVREERPGKPRWRYWLNVIRMAIRYIALRQLDFLFIPGYGHVKCIIAIRLGDIIRSCMFALHAQAVKGR